jgi:hypothetical protein
MISSLLSVTRVIRDLVELGPGRRSVTDNRSMRLNDHDFIEFQHGSCPLLMSLASRMVIEISLFPGILIRWPIILSFLRREELLSTQFRLLRGIPCALLLLFGSFVR